MEWLIAIAAVVLAGRRSAYVPPPRNESGWKRLDSLESWTGLGGARLKTPLTGLKADFKASGWNAKDLQVAWGNRPGRGGRDTDYGRDTADDRGRPRDPYAGGGRPGE